MTPRPPPGAPPRLAGRAMPSAAPLATALLAALVTALVTGCALPTREAPKVPPPVGAAPMPPAGRSGADGPVAPAPATAVWSDQMETAASRLRSSLRGTPVEIAQTTDGRLWLSLPGDDTFAPGRPALKPAAGAWLDQIAAALKQAPKASVQIVGPAGRGGSALALDRASSARDWMVMRGVAPMRVTVSAATAAPGSAGAGGRLDLLIGERAGR